jgi:hypothetical protein
MNPREIEVHIAELVLHGFEPASRWEIASALERQLSTLLAERGLPRNWQASPDNIVAVLSPSHAQTTPAGTGAQVGRAIYEGGAP